MSGIAILLLRKRFLFIVLLFLFPFLSFSQDLNRSKTNEEKDSIIPFKYRVAFRTNTVDWILMLPNLGLEFDLSKSPYNRIALSVNAKGNWSMYHHPKPELIYKLQNVRVELKKYGRTSARYEKDGMKRGFGEKLNDFFNMRVKNPNYWRAYYWGLYFDIGGYDFKFSEQGHSGKYVGVGISLGYGIPLLEYKNGALDLELGASIGAVYAECNSYVYNMDYDDFVDKSSVKRFLPYPVISDLRVALVYRFSSIRNKYKLTDH